MAKKLQKNKQGRHAEKNANDPLIKALNKVVSNIQTKTFEKETILTNKRKPKN